MTSLNETHDPSRRCVVDAANDAQCDFPIQNLPFGIFSVGGGSPSAGVAIGDQIINLAILLEKGALTGDAEVAAQAACSGTTLNALMALGNAPASALRARLVSLLDADSASDFDITEALVPMKDAELHLPASVGDFTDFLTSRHHFSRMRDNAPLALNFMSLPIAYHSRASSIRLDGDIVRPRVQTVEDDVVSFAPTTKCDFELEVGAYIGRENQLGAPIAVDDADSHIFGFCLVNDWSLRDTQRFEGAPLGPFLSKSFSTTISPWIVTEEAMRPFRTAMEPRRTGEPAPLPHLASEVAQDSGALDITLEATIQTAAMRADNIPAERITLTNLKHLYWSFSQMVTHHTSNGCNLRPGDLLASGTASGAADDSCACFAEMTVRGTKPITLSNGESRSFMEDGDSLTISGVALREGCARVGFGSATGTLVANTEV
ncbi:fumarylacetoacetase [Salipiger sp. 1_MG-2023]|uniref:fumarylacetoacetase n=1 Tax=Salipiger sp. 1_MG-2023 TaxID=3062665 RepID=UPI0026E3833A|nr:fumarylacetoacetase [Salipiger sp. 1_MG-2023]MDO6584310.1 fumarylacetoacetase [Salipiger sp. 1_MG-2023]